MYMLYLVCRNVIIYYLLVRNSIKLTDEAYGSRGFVYILFECFLRFLAPFSGIENKGASMELVWKNVGVIMHGYAVVSVFW